MTPDERKKISGEDLLALYRKRGKAEGHARETGSDKSKTYLFRTRTPVLDFRNRPDLPLGPALAGCEKALSPSILPLTRWFMNKPGSIKHYRQRKDLNQWRTSRL